MQYFPVFDKLKKEFFIGEMIWNFADFMTQQGERMMTNLILGILVANVLVFEVNYSIGQHTSLSGF